MDDEIATGSALVPDLSVAGQSRRLPVHDGQEDSTKGPLRGRQILVRRTAFDASKVMGFRLVAGCISRRLNYPLSELPNSTLSHFPRGSQR